MTEQLDSLRHITLNVASVADAANWYRSSFRCETLREDTKCAVLKFQNTLLTLILPSQEPSHIAFSREDAETLGELRKRPDGTLSTYLADPTGNVVKIVKE